MLGRSGQALRTHREECGLGSKVVPYSKVTATRVCQPSSFLESEQQVLSEWRSKHYISMVAPGHNMDPQAICFL